MKFLEYIFSLFFPRRCSGCGEVLTDEELFVCTRCLAGLKITEEALHRGNRLEMLFRAYAPYEKESAPGNKFVRGAAYLYYDKETAAPNIIHAIKFAKDPELARWMGQKAAEELICHDSCFFNGIDLLMPVALHPNRLRERGFNQSDWICRGISDITGIPVDTQHLERIIDTEQQSLKTLAERANLGLIFAIKEPDMLQGKHVLVVDDVITTGSTVSRVLDVLHPIYGCSYSVFALTYAMH